MIEQYIRPTRAQVAVRATPGRGPADRAGCAAPVDEEGDRQARGASKMAPACPIWVNDPGVIGGGDPNKAGSRGD